MAGGPDWVDLQPLLAMLREVFECGSTIEASEIFMRYLVPEGTVKLRELSDRERRAIVACTLLIGVLYQGAHDDPERWQSILDRLGEHVAHISPATPDGSLRHYEDV